MAASMAGGISMAVSGATSTWDGGGSAPSWGLAANWNGNVVPPQTNDVKFGTGWASGRTINVGPYRTARSLIFENASAVTLYGGAGSTIFPDGHALTLTTGDISASSSGTVVIDCKLYLGAAGDFNVGNGTVLHMKRPITGSPPPVPNYFVHRGIWKDGDGELILDAVNTFQGLVTVADGRLTVAKTGALPHTAVWIHGKFYSTPPELRLNANVTANLSFLLMDRESLASGPSTAKINIGRARLRDMAEVDVSLGGTGAVEIAESASVVLHRPNTFTGPLKLEQGSTLTVDDDGNLGASGNTVEVNGFAALVVDDNDGLTKHSRTLSVPAGSELHLAIDSSLNSKLAGAGAVVIMDEGFGSVDLDGNNSGFTGNFFSNKSIDVTSPNAFGNAARVVIENSQDIAFHEDIEAPGTDLESSSGTMITLNNHGVILDALRIGTGSATTLQLSTDGVNGVLDLGDVIFVGSTGSLNIMNWVGNTLASTGDEVRVSTPLSSSELARITFNGQPVRQLNGELVMKP
jgi:autotransporter-associated beta strand protein